MEQTQEIDTEDETRSPVEPTIGRIVHYYPTQHELIKYEAEANNAHSTLPGLFIGKTPVAAMVTAVYPDDRLGLRLLLDAPVTPPHIPRARYSAKAGIVGSWCWPPMVQRRA